MRQLVASRACQAELSNVAMMTQAIQQGRLEGQRQGIAATAEGAQHANATARLTGGWSSLRWLVWCFTVAVILWSLQRGLQYQLGKKAGKDYVDRSVTEAALPRGSIIMWTGSSAPFGWALCDGSLGTPDLVDRFVLGAGRLTPRETGGQWETRISVQQLPAHSHSGHTESNQHSHDYDRVPKGSMAWKKGGRDPFWSGEYNPQYQGAYTSAHSHSHAFLTEPAGDGQPLSLAPPYYALAFIMKL